MCLQGFFFGGGGGVHLFFFFSEKPFLVTLMTFIHEEYFDDAWYKCRIGRNDVLHTRMTTLVGFFLFLQGFCGGWGGGGGGGTFVFFF